MKHYDEKVEFLYLFQEGKCRITGEKLRVGDKWDLHHIIDKGKKNRRRFPLYIDSILNLVLVSRSAHETKTKPSKPPLYVVDIIEKKLLTSPELCSMVNCESEIVTEEVSKLLKELVEGLK